MKNSTSSALARMRSTSSRHAPQQETIGRAGRSRRGAAHAPFYHAPSGCQNAIFGAALVFSLGLSAIAHLPSPDGIADVVKNHDAITGNRTDVHLTFLDAYAQGPPANTYAKLGSNGDWVEQYVCNEQPPTIVIGTDWTLPKAYSIDVTSIKPPGTGSHSWPWMWYLSTVAGPTAADAYGWGFQRTVEFADKHPTFKQYRKGARIDIVKTLGISVATASEPTGVAVEFSPADVVVSNSGQVTILSSNEFTMTTGSPVFLMKDVDITNAEGLIRFSYQFLSKAQGSLELFLDDETLFATDEEDSLGVEDTGWLLPGDSFLPGEHNLKSLLTPTTTNQSTIRISSIELGSSFSVNELPVLNTQVGQEHITLLWSDTFADFTLTASGVLTGNWTNVAGPYSEDNSFLKVTIPAPGTSQFYRLQK